MVENLNKSRFDSFYDAVVIGTGMGGLTAGLKMAASNKKVLVLEQHNLPGGFATSFVRGKYEFEATLHELLDFDEPDRKGDIRKILDGFGVKYELNRVPEPYVLVVPSQNINIKVPFGVKEFTETVVKESPQEKNKIEKYINLCKNVYNCMIYLRDCKAKGEKPSKIKLMTKYKGFLHNAHKTVLEVDKEFDFSERIRSILYAYWCYQGPALDTLTFTTFAYMLIGYLTTGAYVPTNRSHSLSTGIINRIIELGGQVEFNAKVTDINLENNHVKSICLADGTLINTNYILSNAHPEQVYGMMIKDKKEIPQFSIKKMNAEIDSCSAATLYLGLNADPDEIGIGSYEYFIGETMDTRKIHDGFFTLDAPTFVSAICLDKAVPGTTGKGICQLSITGLMMGDAFKDVTMENYFEIKDKLAEDLINIFEKSLNIDLRPYIEEVEMVTPETWTRYTGAYKGKVFGYEQTPWDAVIFRTAVEDEEKKYEIQGLEFVGGCSSSAHAYSCSIKSGVHGATKTIKEMEVSK